MKFSSIIVLAVAPLAAFALKESDTAVAQADRRLEATFNPHLGPITYFDTVVDFSPLATKLKGAKLTLRCDDKPTMVSYFQVPYVIPAAFDGDDPTQVAIGTDWKNNEDKVVANIVYAADASTFLAPMVFDIGVTELGCTNPKVEIDLRTTCVKTDTGACSYDEICAVFDYDIVSAKSPGSQLGKVQVHPLNNNVFTECTAAKVDAYHQAFVDGGDPVNDNDLWFLYKVDVSDCADAATYRFFFDSDVLERSGGGMCGEPHVKTWSGKYFDYMGECDLVLLHAPDFDGKGIDLDVHVRTTIRYWYSFIEVAAVQIGDEILEVGAYGNHALNYVDDALADARNHRTIGGYPVYHTQPSLKKHVYDIVLGPGQNITITSFKDLVGVHTTSHHFPSGVSGIMGSINGTMLGRDGVTDMSADTDAFGQEWQVRDAEPNLFRAIRDPQYPTKCNLPSAAVQEHRRLAESSVDEEDAKKACAKYSSGKELDNCVYDIMAMGDLEYAEAGSF